MELSVSLGGGQLTFKQFHVKSYLGWPCQAILSSALAFAYISMTIILHSEPHCASNQAVIYTQE